jgi:hypothetical protein
MPIELLFIIAVFVFVYWFSSDNDKAIALMHKLGDWFFFYERPLLKRRTDNEALATSESTPVELRAGYAKKAKRAQHLLTLINIVLFGPMALVLFGALMVNKIPFLSDLLGAFL